MVGCVGAPQVMSDLPVDAPGASRVLLGTWNVYTHEGELDGTLTFLDDEVQVLTGPSWYHGVWSLQTDSGGRFGLQMTFNGVEILIRQEDNATFEAANGEPLGFWDEQTKTIIECDDEDE